MQKDIHITLGENASCKKTKHLNGLKKQNVCICKNTNENFQRVKLIKEFYLFVCTLQHYLFKKKMTTSLVL